MKIYSRSAFLQLPEGTLFCKGKPWYWGTLMLKGESLPNDFIYRDLCWVDAESSSEATEAFEEMLTQGVSVPMESAYGRDGCFDNDDIFLVFEEPDLEQLSEIIDNARQLQTKTQQAKA